jgi:hypothetical protein
MPAPGYGLLGSAVISLMIPDAASVTRNSAAHRPALRWPNDAPAKLRIALRNSNVASISWTAGCMNTDSHGMAIL